MEKRQLGKDGPRVSAMGLGCMAMSEFYGKRPDDACAREVIRTALDLGVTFLDTADTYGDGHNEELVAGAVKTWQQETGQRAFIASKFGIVRKKGAYQRQICGRPEYVRSALEASLGRLGLETIDLYYIHRIDITVPIEETMGALSDLVREGKIRFIGISEPSVATLSRAHKVHPVTCVQSEFSLFTREPEKELLPFLREQGIGFVPYSPLGRGMLTGALTREKLTSDETDMRQYLPRTRGENFDHNAALVNAMIPMARDRGLPLSTLALAWVLSKGEDIVPIPGTRQSRYLKENIRAAKIRLTPGEMEALESVFHMDAVQGERYTPEGMKGLNG